MPILVEFPSPEPALSQTFAKVLRDDPSHAASLEQALQDGNSRIAAAHFNGQPVGVAVLSDANLAWMVVHPATRGRGVGRDFLRQIEKQLGQSLVMPRECEKSGV